MYCIREQRDSLCPKKRSREEDSPHGLYGSREEVRGRFGQDRSSYRREESSDSRSGQSAYTVYPGDFDRRRGSPPSRRGGRGRYNY